MRRRERGLTLTEILLSLIVMVLGLLGILALFPHGLEQGKQSMELNYAAFVAESVAEAVAVAAKMPALDQPGTPGQHYKLTITHDSINSHTKDPVYYEILLPNFSDGMAGVPTPNAGTQWFHHPAFASPAVGDVAGTEPEKESDWRLVGDPWTRAEFEAIKGKDRMTGTDGSEPLDQFCYSIDVRKVNTLEYLMEPPPDGKSLTLDQLDSMIRMWEFRIHVFRAGGGSGEAVAGVTPKRIIATLTTRITIR